MLSGMNSNLRRLKSDGISAASKLYLIVVASLTKYQSWFCFRFSGSRSQPKKFQ